MSSIVTPIICICLSVCLSVHFPACAFVELPAYLFVCFIHHNAFGSLFLFLSNPCFIFVPPENKWDREKMGTIFLLTQHQLVESLLEKSDFASTVAAFLIFFNVVVLLFHFIFLLLSFLRSPFLFLVTDQNVYIYINVSFFFLFSLVDSISVVLLVSLYFTFAFSYSIYYKFIYLFIRQFQN